MSAFDPIYDIGMFFCMFGAISPTSIILFYIQIIIILKTTVIN